MWYELSTWCVRGNCSLSSIGTSFTKNLFSLTGAINEIAEIAVELWKSDGVTDYTLLDEAYYTY